MKKLLSVLLLGLTLLLTGCGDQPGAKPGEQFVGTWQNPDSRYQYEIKRNGDDFIVKIQQNNQISTVEGKLLDDTLIVNGTLNFTIDQTTGEMVLRDTGRRYKKAE